MLQTGRAGEARVLGEPAQQRGVLVEARPRPVPHAVVVREVRVDGVELALELGGERDLARPIR
jgi:hypothetical protein